LERDCRVIVVRLDGRRVETGTLDTSVRKLGILNFGNFSLGSENELVSGAGARLAAEILDPVIRIGRIDSVDLAAMSFLNGFEIAGNLNPSAYAETQ